MGFFKKLFGKIKSGLHASNPNIPSDITKRVIKLYPNEKEQKVAMKIIQDFHEGQGRRDLVVGASQFCRAILTLAENNIDELQRLADIPEDERDIIMSAESKIGNPEHYFIIPFND